MERLDVVVTCLHHHDDVRIFPQVRGATLARGLASIGLAARFVQLPVADVTAEVVISSEYQADLPWFTKHVAGGLTDIGASRLYCLTDNSLGDRPHFSSEMLQWFGARGGVLCHQEEEPPAAYETVVGVVVDASVVPPPVAEPVDVLLDAAVDTQPDGSPLLSVEDLDALRRLAPGLRLVGTGEETSVFRDAFDAWIPYGQPHGPYLAALLPSAAVFIPFRAEAMGLVIAEAQLAGAAIVHAPHMVKPPMRCPSADVPTPTVTGPAFVDAVLEAAGRDHVAIAAEAASRFDLDAVARRVKAAIGL